MKRHFLSIGISLVTLLAAGSASAESISRDCHVTVIAIVKVKSGTEKQFKAMALSILRATRNESGNLLYTFNQNLKDPTSFDTYEKWKTEGDLDTHMQTPHMKAFFAQVGNYFAAPPDIHVLKNIECN